ncbi:MAG TPA: hypothetical protein VIH21_01805 [Dehalococcoidia bacterium]|jgi:septal ring factor EnvC (AmiA/AmiB activator)
MATKSAKNRYRTMRAAILSASVLSILPLVAAMKSVTSDSSARVGTVQAALASASNATPSAQNQASATQSGVGSTSKASAAATPATSSAKSSTSKTYTRTKAS